MPWDTADSKAVARGVRRHDQQPVLEGGSVHHVGRVHLVGEKRRPVARVDQLHPQQKAAATNFPHDLAPRDRRLQICQQRRAPLGDLVHQTALHQQVDGGQAHGGGERRAVPRVAQVELAGPPVKGVVNLRRAQHRSEGSVAGSQPLSHADDVGRDGHLVRGEPRSHPSHAGDDLVEADQEAVPLAPLSKPLPEAGRRRIPGQSRGAHRLAEEGRHTLRPRLL